MKFPDLGPDPRFTLFSNYLISTRFNPSEISSLGQSADVSWPPNNLYIISDKNLSSQ